MAKDLWGGDEIGLKIHQTLDGGYILSGVSNGVGAGGFDLWLIKTDSLGSVEWDKAYGTALDDRLGGVSVSKDEGYIAWGRLDTIVYNTEDTYAALVMKLDEDGNVIWRTFFNHKKERIIDQLRELEDESIVAIGEQELGGFDSSSGWIAKLNSSGDILWERFYPGPAYLGDTLSGNSTSFNGDFKQTSDGGFVIAGQAWRGSIANPNILRGHPWLVKLDSNGCLGPDSCGLAVGIKEPHEFFTDISVTIFPTLLHTQSLVCIKGVSQNWTGKKTAFSLYNISGRRVIQHEASLNEYGYAEFYLQRGSLISGVYIYSVAGNSEVLGRGKIIVQ